MTDEQRAEGWIDHDGGPCPVGVWQPVTIMRRDGKIASHPDCRHLDWLPWEDDPHTDIIAYRPAP